MSSRLLKLMGKIPTPPLIDHRASDDLESLFYIFLEFVTVWGGPGRLSEEGVHPDNAQAWRDICVEMPRRGISVSGTLKKEFITDDQPRYEPAPYFRACRPVLEEWRKAIGVAVRKERDVSHGEILESIERGRRALESLPAAPPLPPSTSRSMITRSMRKNQKLPPSVPGSMV
jgi:hypothetical protein